MLLQDKEAQCCVKVKKLKKISKCIKIISISLSISTIIILSVMASTLVLSPLAVSILSIISASLVAIDFKFKFQNKSREKKQMIEKLNKIHLKLEYINSKNGDLTEQEFNDIFEQFNI